ncbi:MAG: glycoside hydrolase family 13 protein [Desulfurococcaceae archaeon]
MKNPMLVITVVLALMLSIQLAMVSTSITQLEIYINEFEEIKHDLANPVYVSIADNSIILRISVPRWLNVSRISIVLENTSISMKPQLYLENTIIWYARLNYTDNLKYYFKIELNNETVLILYNTRESKSFTYKPVELLKQITWVSPGVGYQIFPDRFFNGDPSNDFYGPIYDSLLYDNTTSMHPVLSNWSDPPHNPLHCCHQYFGGDIRGIIEKLDYLKGLNITLLYLTPIFLCGSVHCYDTYDYYQIHPRLGTLDDLKELLSEAHMRGMRVIFDFVPGHVGLGFWAFQDVYVNGRNSKYWSWFTIYQWPFTPGNGRHYRCWWGFGSLPQLNTSNPEVRQYLIDAVLYWLDFGFDGVRIDTPLDLPNPRDFFQELRDAVKTRHPDAYIVGEIWELKPEWVNTGPFDSLMNYALGNILVAYSRGEIHGKISSVLSYYYSRYSVAAVGIGFNIIGSHDTDRVLTMMGGGALFPEPRIPREAILRLKLLSTLQYTQPGIPVIFQGDERGLPGIKLYPYEEHRYPIQWDKIDLEVFNHYKKLGEIKRGTPALHTSIIRIIETDNGILAYTRGYSEDVLIIANNMNTSAKFRLPPDLANAEWTLVYTSSGEIPEINGTDFIIPPLTAVILFNKGIAEQGTPQDNIARWNLLEIIILSTLLLSTILIAIILFRRVH